MHLLAESGRWRQRAGLSNSSGILVWYKKIFCFSSKTCGPWTNVHTSKLCLSHGGKNMLPAFSRKWVTRYESNALYSFCLHPSLTFFAVIIPLFNSVVWSCFTPVHPHRLPFSPISPSLICLCAIIIDRQKIKTSGPLMPPECQGSSSTPTPLFLYTHTSNEAIMYYFPAVSWV